MHALSKLLELHASLSMLMELLYSCLFMEHVIIIEFLDS